MFIYSPINPVLSPPCSHFSYLPLPVPECFLFSSKSLDKLSPSPSFFHPSPISRRDFFLSKHKVWSFTNTQFSSKYSGGRFTPCAQTAFLLVILVDAFPWHCLYLLFGEAQQCAREVRRWGGRGESWEKDDGDRETRVMLALGVFVKIGSAVQKSGVYCRN